MNIVFTIQWFMSTIFTTILERKAVWERKRNTIKFINWIDTCTRMVNNNNKNPQACCRCLVKLNSSVNAAPADGAWLKLFSTFTTSLQKS